MNQRAMTEQEMLLQNSLAKIVQEILSKHQVSAVFSVHILMKMVIAEYLAQFKNNATEELFMKLCGIVFKEMKISYDLITQPAKGTG